MTLSGAFPPVPTTWEPLDPSCSCLPSPSHIGSGFGGLDLADCSVPCLPRLEGNEREILGGGGVSGIGGCGYGREGSSCLEPFPKTWMCCKGCLFNRFGYKVYFPSACPQLNKYTGGHDLSAPFKWGLIQNLPRIYLPRPYLPHLLQFANCGSLRGPLSLGPLCRR